MKRIKKIWESSSLFIYLILSLSLNAQDWNQYRGPNKTGSLLLDAPSLLKIDNLSWKFNPGYGQGTSPVVNKNNLYFGQGKNFYCLDRFNGSEKWKVKFQDEEKWSGQTSQPLVGENTIYFGSHEGFFYALNTDNGEVRWKIKAGELITSSPAMANDIIYFSAFDSLLHAVNAKNGKEIWSYKTTGGDASPIVVNGVVYVGSDKGHIYALSAKEGKLKWKFNAKDRIYEAAVYYDGMVYFGSDDRHVYALNATNGEKVWDFDFRSYIFRSPTIYKGRIIVSTYSGSLVALDAKTGSEIWRSNYYVSGEPVVINGWLLIATFDASTKQYLRTLSVSDGREIKALTEPIYSYISGEPVYTDNWLYLSCGIIAGYKVSQLKSQLKPPPPESFQTTVGTMTWTSKNLSTDRFVNGDSIQQVKTFDAWKQALDKHQPAWCYYQFSELYAFHGKFYNWYAVNDARGLAPKGWHIPKYEEWEKLLHEVGDNPWDKMVDSSYGWINGLTKTSNSSNFSILGGGLFSGSSFGGLGIETAFWSAAKDASSITKNTNLITIHFGIEWANTRGVGKVLGQERDGMYVRLVKD